MMSASSIAMQKPVAGLQTYIMSLSYLKQEANSDGLPEVAGIMQNALADIAVWVDKRRRPRQSHDLLDIPLCQALEFLQRFYSLSPARRQQALKLIEEYEVEAFSVISAGRERVSKKRGDRLRRHRSEMEKPRD